MPYTIANYMKAAKLIPKYFMFINLESHYLTDTLLQDPSTVPSDAVAILQLWINTNEVLPIQCYLNSHGERIEAGSKNCNNDIKHRIDSWLSDIKVSA